MGSASATIRIRSPGPAPRSPARPSRKRATGERSDPSGSTTAQTSPLAPSSRASSMSSSPTLRLTPAPAPGTTIAAHHPAGRQGPLEDPEPRRRGPLAPVLDLDPVAQVGPVGAEAAHRLRVGHARERQLQLHPAGGERLAQHSLDQLLQLGRLDERRLHVELGELRLAVGAQVLVAEAADDLVVALQPAHHQQLLEELRALRQRVPGARLQAAGHQEVARALGGRARQHRRLDLEEAGGVERPAHGGDDPGAQLERRQPAAVAAGRGSGRSGAAPRRAPAPRPPPRTAAGRPRRGPPAPSTRSSTSPVGRAGLTVSAERAHDLALGAHHVLRAQPAGGRVRPRRRRGGRRAGGSRSGRGGR